LMRRVSIAAGRSGIFSVAQGQAGVVPFGGDGALFDSTASGGYFRPGSVEPYGRRTGSRREASF